MNLYKKTKKPIDMLVSLPHLRLGGDDLRCHPGRPLRQPRPGLQGALKDLPLQLQGALKLILQVLQLNVLLSGGLK